MPCCTQHGDGAVPDPTPWWDLPLVWPPIRERVHGTGPFPVRRLLTRKGRPMPEPSACITPRSPDGTPRSILAINNDPAVLGLFRDLLEQVGFRVSTQNYVDRDLEQIKRQAPDLIVLDYMWANEDASWSLLQMLRMDPATTAIPIILCTGAAREVEALAEHLLAMDVSVILKPFNIDHLLHIM